MLELSLGAVAYVEHARHRLGLPDSAGLRFWVDLEARNAQFRVGFTRLPERDDEIVEKMGAKVFIASELRDMFTRQVLDVDEGADPPQLVLRSREKVA